ncbi:transposable element Tcb1 transposase [Trichonephila clavipes]|nr:transposable element Tcb1 transposase [Trichonephila clavipes]
MALKSKELDVNVKNMIIQLRNEGLTYRAIGIQLNISLFTVRSVVKRFNETGFTENKVRSGRPGIFSAREKRSIIKEVKKNPQIRAPHDGRQYRKPNTELEKQHLTPTVKHGGGSVLVWGCMPANGVGKLCFIDGIITAHTYIDILRHNLQSSAQKLGLGTSFVFQQDNDPKHTANLTWEWLLYNSPRQLKMPPQSPDINSIENLWHKLDVEVRKQNFV